MKKHVGSLIAIYSSRSSCKKFRYSINTYRAQTKYSMGAVRGEGGRGKKGEMSVFTQAPMDLCE